LLCAKTIIVFFLLLPSGALSSPMPITRMLSRAAVVFSLLARLPRQHAWHSGSSPINASLGSKPHTSPISAPGQPFWS